MLTVPVKREPRWPVPGLGLREGLEPFHALDIDREHVRDVFVERPGVADDRGDDLPVLGEVASAIDVV